MLIDAREVQEIPRECDICIIGAGAAGITLAMALKDSGLRICLLESGGLEAEADTQALYAGSIDGFPYYPLDTARLRYFGGTTGHWGGCCWPLEEHEFRKRDWVPNSGWPISRKDLAPYYVKAQETCELGPFNYDPAFWSAESDRPLLPFGDGRVVTRIYQNSTPTRFGSQYREDIKNATDISAILHANLTNMGLDPVNRSVDKVTVSVLGGRQFDINTGTVVLAAGGLENPRLLLLNDIGNQNDLVGRYFMDHIIFSAATLMLRGDVDTDLYQRATVNGTDIRAGLSLSPDTLAAEEILNSWSGLQLERSPALVIEKEWSKITSALSEGEIPDKLTAHIRRILQSLRELYTDKWHDDEKKVVIPVQSFSEQSPNPQSRVILGEDRDALGQRRIRLDWRITDLERTSIRRTQEIIAAEIGKNNLGRMQVLVPDEANIWSTPLSTDNAEAIPSGSFHHMGTTRMHDDPKQGVVDRDCRVHGTRNLYVAGSSVFPTVGFENPTLTIVALAHRLGDHLKSSNS